MAAIDDALIRSILSPPASAALDAAQTVPSIPTPPPPATDPQVPPGPPAPVVVGPQERTPAPIAIPRLEPEIIRALGNLQRLLGGDQEMVDEDVGWMAVNLDRSTGAPAGVRFAVGSAGTDQDRLNALRARYTMSVPVPGTDNFIFMDPETGVPTLFNEDSLPDDMMTPTIPGLEGARLRDLIERFPDVAEFIGMGVVGGLGAASPAGLVGGGAAGAAVGGPLFRRGAEMAGQALTGAEDTRSQQQKLTESAVSAAVGAGSTLVPAAGAAIVRSGLRGLKNRMLLNPRTLTRSADRIEDAIRNAGGGTADDVAAAAQIAADGPAADVWRLARRPAIERPAAQIAARRAEVGDELWDGIAGNVWAEMAGGESGASARALANNLSRMPRDVRAALFGRSRYAEAERLMDELVPYVGATSGMRRVLNMNAETKKLLAPLIGGSLGLGVGGPAGAAAGLAGGVAAGFMKNAKDMAVTRALSSPTFLRWVTTGAQVANRSPSAVPSLMLRLPAIAEMEPELRDSLEVLYPEAFNTESGSTPRPPLR